MLWNLLAFGMIQTEGKSNQRHHQTRRFLCLFNLRFHAESTSNYESLIHNLRLRHSMIQIHSSVSWLPLLRNLLFQTMPKAKAWAKQSTLLCKQATVNLPLAYEIEDFKVAYWWFAEGKKISYYACLLLAFGMKSLISNRRQIKSCLLWNRSKQA